MNNDLDEAERNLQRAREDFYALQNADSDAMWGFRTVDEVVSPLQPIIDKAYSLSQLQRGRQNG